MIRTSLIRTSLIRISLIRTSPAIRTSRTIGSMASARWVVVGAGSAGCVAAGRLSEDPDRSVVLLETGTIGVDGALPAAVAGPDFLAALAVPGVTHEGLVASRTSGGPTTPYARGRGLGGSSLVNAMVALDPDPATMPTVGDAELAAGRGAVALGMEVPADDELGPIDRCLLAAAPDAERVLLTRKDGRRHTSAEAYLRPAAGRGNLSVRVGALVDRVEFDGRRAVGVRLADGELVDADRVVLAAGAVHTPAVLLRSGVDTPGVGDGLQDHPSATFTLGLRDSGDATADGLVCGSLLRRDPIQFLPMNHVGVAGFAALLVALMRPAGRNGSVRLADDDPASQPIVDFALLEDPGDLAALVVGVREALELLRTPPFDRVVADVYLDAVGTTAAELDDESSIADWLRRSVGDYVHATGTCAIGDVVDEHGRLHGYDGVLVCDASVFPTITDVNTHLPTTVMAEVLTARWRRADGELPRTRRA
jgi:choline dehydrogenase-like flavoprotein